MNEIWKDIKGYEGYYQVSNLGKIKRLEGIDNIGRKKRSKILKPTKFSNGYFFVSLSKNGKSKKESVHKLVANNFLKTKECLVVNHKDRDKGNNKLENLELVTQKENIRHAWKNNLSKPTRTKAVNQYCLKGNFIKRWESIMEVERKLNINNSHIVSCCKGKRNKTGGYKWSYADSY